MASGVALVGGGGGEEKGNPRGAGGEDRPGVGRRGGKEPGPPADGGDGELDQRHKQHPRRRDLHGAQSRFVAVKVSIYLAMFMRVCVFPPMLLLVVFVIMVVMLMAMFIMLVVVIVMFMVTCCRWFVHGISLSGCCSLCIIPLDTLYSTESQGDREDRPSATEAAHEPGWTRTRQEGPPCHADRSEASRCPGTQTLPFPQVDTDSAALSSLRIRPLLLLL